MSQVKKVMNGTGFPKKPLADGTKNEEVKAEDTKAPEPQQEEVKDVPVSDTKQEATPSSEEDAILNEAVNAFYEEQRKKELKQDIAGNYTLVINHDLMERLDNLAEHYPRGFKSELVNKALEAFVSIYEKKEHPERRKKRGRR